MITPDTVQEPSDEEIEEATKLLPSSGLKVGLLVLRYLRS